MICKPGREGTRFVEREREREKRCISVEGCHWGEGSPVLTQEPEGSLYILYCNCMLQYMQVVLRAEKHCMEGTAITISIIALEEETMPGAVFEKSKLSAWL